MANLMIVNYEASIVLTGTLHSILKLFIRLATDSQCHVLPELRGRSQEEDRDVVRGRDEARQAREEGVDALPSAKTTDLQNQHFLITFEEVGNLIKQFTTVIYYSRVVS